MEERRGEREALRSRGNGTQEKSDLPQQVASLTLEISDISPLTWITSSNSRTDYLLAIRSPAYDESYDAARHIRTVANPFRERVSLI